LFQFVVGNIEILQFQRAYFQLIVNNQCFNEIIGQIQSLHVQFQRALFAKQIKIFDVVRVEIEIIDSQMCERFLIRVSVLASDSN
jgi:hypothetical protein